MLFTYHTGLTISECHYFVFFLNLALLIFFLPSPSSEIVSHSLRGSKNKYGTFCGTKWRWKISISIGILNYSFSIWRLSVGKNNIDMFSLYQQKKERALLALPLISMSEYLFEETSFSAPFHEGTNRADIHV